MGNPVQDGYAVTEPLELDIDIEKIAQGVKDWDKVIDAVEIGVNLGIQELSERMHSKILEYLTMYGLMDTNLANTIAILPIGEGISITVASEYAVYIEYGTGIVGASNPHPHPWAYDINEHGDEGWWYPTTESDPNPKKRYNKQTGEIWAWTKGQASKPFMYMTWLWATRSATNIIRKNIRNEIKKVNGVR